MIIDSKPVETTGTMDGFTASKISEADMAQAMQFFASVYSRPKDAVLRELAANGRDAQREAGYTGPVEISLPTMDHPQVVVTDHGTGMDRERLTEVFGNYVASTKRSSAADIGGFGVGSKTPFAVADQFHVQSTHEGVTRLLIFTKLPSGATGFKIVSEVETGGSSGTTITVPVSLDGHSDWTEAAARVFYWWEQDTVLVDGAQPQTYHDEVEGLATLGRIQVMRTMRGGEEWIVRINGVGYSVPRAMAEAVSNSKVFLRSSTTVIFDATDAPLVISKSRESIDDTEAGRQWLGEQIKIWSESIAEKVSTEATASVEKLTSTAIFQATRTLPYAVRGIVGFWFEEKLLKAQGLPEEFTQYSMMYERTFNARDTVVLKRPGIIPGRSLFGLSQQAFMDSSLYTDSNKLDSAIRRFLKSDDNSFHILVITAKTEHFDQVFGLDQVTWVTPDEIIAKAPGPTRSSRRKDGVTKLEVLSMGKVSPVRRAFTPEQIAEMLTDDVVLIVGTIQDYKFITNNNHLSPDRFVFVKLGARTPERISKLVGHPAYRVQQGLQLIADQSLQKLRSSQWANLITALSFIPKNRDVLRHKRNELNYDLRRKLDPILVDDSIWVERLGFESEAELNAMAHRIMNSDLLKNKGISVKFPLLKELMGKVFTNPSTDLITAVLEADIRNGHV